MIPERLSALRAEMAKRNIDLYVVPTADFHESEYVGEYFKARKYITGFTGSAGTAVITMTEAGLWTDGRYFVQAERQLKDTTVTLYRMGEEGVPTVDAFIADKLPQGGKLGFDGRVINSLWGKRMAKMAEEKNAAIACSEDLMDLIWQDRPALPASKAWILDEKYAGQSAAEKLTAVRKVMAKKKATVHILTSLYDIAWLLNIRGDDISHVPVILSFLVLTEQECIWFVQDAALTDEIKAYLAPIGVSVKPYTEIYAYAAQLPADACVLLAPGKVNFSIVSAFPAGVKTVEMMNPSEPMRGKKNPVEVANTIAAHVKDGVAVTKFMYWLKKNIGKQPMTEISASDYLASLRAAQPGFLDLSFDTICAYGANAAMMHYSATPESNAELKPEGFLLVDSGGHYLEGSTDITRTFVLGPITEEMREHFTAVCRSNLNLAAAKFLYGVNGPNLDILARGPLWDLGIDYKCGTGHGVGYILNVHEGPNNFAWQLGSARGYAAFEEGHITTDEPGVYREGLYGIRTENELVCRKAEKNEYGQFMEFENITYAPIDLDAIDPDAMTKKERQRLNDYHKLVYTTLAPYMTEEEKVWLAEYTREV